LRPTALAATVLLSLSIVIGVRFLGPGTPEAPARQPNEARNTEANAEFGASDAVSAMQAEPAPAGDSAEQPSDRFRVERAPACNDIERPEPWLACISAMLANGLEAEATAELHSFVQRYPDHVLPRDLAALGIEQP
jgi:hypothetical protein